MNPLSILRPSSRVGIVAVALAVVLLGLVMYLIQVNHTGGEEEPPAGKVIQPEFFGQHLINKQNWPSHRFGSLGKGTFISWPYIEQQEDIYDWSNLDAWVAQAEDHGVKMFYSSDGIPPWATTDTSTCWNRFGVVQSCSAPPDMSAWTDFVQDLVARYGDQIDYECMNEPQNAEHWSGTPSELVPLCKKFEDIVRAGAPNSRVLPPSGSPSFMDAYYAAGGSETTDAVVLHAYPAPDHPEGPLPEGFVKNGYLLMPYLDVWAKHGLLNKPRWNTEGSWGEGTVTDADKAWWVARWYILHAAYGFERNYWYAYDNALYGTLWTSSGGDNAGAAAYDRIYEWLLGTTGWQKPVYNTADPYNSLYSVDLKLSDGRAARLVWHTDHSATYDAPPEFSRYRDFQTDETHSISLNRLVPIDHYPVMLLP